MAQVHELLRSTSQDALFAPLGPGLWYKGKDGRDYKTYGALRAANDAFRRGMTGGVYLHDLVRYASDRLEAIQLLKELEQIGQQSTQTEKAVSSREVSNDHPKRTIGKGELVGGGMGVVFREPLTPIE